MGVADRYLALDKLTGGVTVQPDMDAVVKSVAGLPGGAQNAYPGRTTALSTGRSAYLLDVASAPFTQDEFQQFSGGQAAMSYGRGGAALPTASALLAQQPMPAKKSGGLWGAVTGALGDVEDAAVAPFKASLNALSFAYDEGISQPLATLFTVLSDGSQWKGSQWGKLLYAENWERAYHIADHRSPAQAAFLAFMTSDIFNEDQIAKSQGTDAFRYGTGILDGAFNWYLDPLTIAAGGLKGFREGLAIAQAGKTEQEIQAGVDLFTEAGGQRRWGRTFAQMNDTIEKHLTDAYNAFGVAKGTYHAGAEALATARVRETMFKNVTRGDTVAYLLTSAKGPEERLLATKALMGDNRALSALREHNLALGDTLGDFTRKTSQIDSLEPFESAVREEGLANLSSESQAGTMAVVEEAEKATDPTALAWKQLDPAHGPETLFAQLGEAPGQSLFNKMTEATSSSKLFQSAPMQNLVRVTSVKTPRNIMDVSQRGADVRFDNLMKYVGNFDEGERAAQRGKFMLANETQRWMMVQSTQEEALRRMATKSGLGASEVEALVNTMKTGQQVGTSILEQAKATKSADAAESLAAGGQRMYSPNRRDIIWFKDADGVKQGVHSPLLETQTSSLAFVYNWRNIRSALSDTARLKARIPGVDLATSLSDKFMDIWKPSVLLSPRIGARNVLLDEGMATAAKIHSVADFLDVAKTLKTQGHNFVVNEMRQLGLNAPEKLRDMASKAGIIDVDGMTVDEIVQHMADRNISQVLEKENNVRSLSGLEPIDQLSASKVASITDQAGQDAAALQRSTKLKAMRVGALTGAALGYATGGIEGALLGTVGGTGLANRMAQFERLGLSGLSVNGFDVEASIGDRSNLSEMTRQEITGDHNNITDWLAQHEDLHMKNMRATGSWGVVGPETQEWGPMWERVTNLQYGQDRMARKLLNGDSPESVAQWLMTAEGKQYLSTLPRKAGVHYDIDRARTHVDNVNAEINDLFMGDEGLKTAAMNQNATAAKARALVGPNVDKLPSIHAEAHAQTLGNGEHGRIKKSVDKFFGLAFTAPIDELARIPYFDTVYRADVTRRVEALGSSATEAELRNVAGAARNVAMDETKRMFYDATDRTDLHTILRNMVPFLPAQQDAIERWARITIDNPVFTARMRSAWMGLDKTVASVTDENGDKTLQFALPGWAKGLVDHSPLFKHAFDSSGRIAINKDSLNMITGGGLGFGPITQLVASKVVEMKPELNDVLGWAIPYGSNTNLIDVVSPGWLRRGEASTGDENSRRFMNQFHTVLSAKIVDMQLGKTPRINFGDSQQVTALVDQAKTETKNLFKLSAAAQFGLPIGVTTVSPYAKQIEAYHQLEQKLGPDAVDAAFLEQYGQEFNDLVARNDIYAKSLIGQSGGDVGKAEQAYIDQNAPHGARETFIARYGEAYAPLTEGASKGNLPATTEAYQAQERMGDLMRSYPQIATLIAGKEGVPEGAKFNRAVYDHQFSSGDRTLHTPEELVTDPQTQLGWDAFSRQMDLLDHSLFSRYGTSEHSMPPDLAMAKSMMVDKLAKKYPTWYQDYVDVDGSKWAKKIEGMTKLANDPRAKDRPELVVLNEYLALRSKIARSLAVQRAAGLPGTLTAKANAGLAHLWDSKVQALVEKSTDFGTLFHRWLENDPLTRDPTGLSA